MSSDSLGRVRDDQHPHQLAFDDTRLQPGEWAQPVSACTLLGLLAVAALPVATGADDVAPSSQVPDQLAAQQASTEPLDDSRPANLVVDFNSHSSAEAWVAAALEQNVHRDLAGFARLLPFDKRRADTAACGAREPDCMLAAYVAAGVDIVMLGRLRDQRLRFSVYETWTRSLVSTGSYTLTPGTSPARIRLRTLSALNPILRSGGLLDQRPFLEERRRRAERAVADQSAHPAQASRDLVQAGLVLLILLFASPLLFAWRMVGRARLVAEGRRGSRVASATIMLGLTLLLGLYVSPYWQLAMATIARVTGDLREFELLLALLGGLLWGWFALVNLRVIVPRLSGIERVGHRNVRPLLATWAANLILRSGLLLLYTPFALVVVFACQLFAVDPFVALVLVAPVAGLAVYFWFFTLVDNLALYLDDALPSGVANADNPWHQAAMRYFRGYVRRGGIPIDQRLLRRALLLPTDGEELLAYGGGFSRPRILIPIPLLELALGGTDEPTVARERTDGTGTGALAEGMIVPHLEERPRPGPRALRRYVRRLEKRRRKLRARPFRLRGARRLIGENATPLGYLLPSPTEETVPLISDSREDFGIVRELLTFHYAAFDKGLYAEEYDDTDPSQKDFLFGAILRELGRVLRGDSLFATIALAFDLWLRARPSSRIRRWIHSIATLIANLRRRFFVRYPAALADAYAALNLGGDALVQYLHFARTGNDEMLTARADAPKLLATSRAILMPVTDEEPRGEDRHLFRATLRNRLIWLSRLFYSAIEQRRRVWRHVLVTVLVLVALGAGTAWTVRESIDYHPTYIKRMQELAAAIAEAKAHGISELQEGIPDE